MKTPSITPNAIRKRNQAFNKLTKPQQRVAIAKDVLAQLKSKNIKASSGTYIWSRSLTSKLTKADENSQFCELLPKIGTCNVCAKGAMFLSTILKQDDLKVGDTPIGACSKMRYIADDEIVDYLNDVFSKHQLDLIEDYFECSSNLDLTHTWDDLNDTQRLQALMENIITNNGTFNPDQINKLYPDKD